MSRNLFYSSYFYNPNVWFSGIFILLFLMSISFLYSYFLSYSTSDSLLVNHWYLSHVQEFILRIARPRFRGKFHSDGAINLSFSFRTPSILCHQKLFYHWHRIEQAMKRRVFSRPGQIQFEVNAFSLAWSLIHLPCLVPQDWVAQEGFNQRATQPSISLFLMVDPIHRFSFESTQDVRA